MVSDPNPTRVPVCMEDFCDRCGDCLGCNGSDPCVHNDDGPHLWEIEDGVFVDYPPPGRPGHAD